jgi:hypothetical protein
VKTDCGHCGTFGTTEVAPGFKNISVAHVRAVDEELPKDERAIQAGLKYVPCTGNAARVELHLNTHLAQRIAMQHEVFENDAYWDEL